MFLSLLRCAANRDFKAENEMQNLARRGIGCIWNLLWSYFLSTPVRGLQRLHSNLRLSEPHAALQKPACGFLLGFK